MEKGLTTALARHSGRRTVSTGKRSSSVVTGKGIFPGFEEMYGDYSPLILRYCTARMPSQAEAEDATATIFTKALAAWPPDDPAAVRSWLFAIAHNVVASLYRTTYANTPPRPLDEGTATPDLASTPEELVISGDERARLRAAVAELNRDQRQVVELRLAGLTGPEIADATGRSHAAVKMLQHRAIKNLRSVLTLADERPEVLRIHARKEGGNG